MSRSLSALSQWYGSHCNRSWEHQFGVTLTTLDNPGWLLKVDLEDTELEHVPFKKLTVQRTDDDWMTAYVDKRKFIAGGGVGNLEEIISTFIEWAEMSRTDKLIAELIAALHEDRPDTDGWTCVNKTDIVGPSHWNRETDEEMCTPHIHEDSATDGTRPANADEIPRRQSGESG